MTPAEERALLEATTAGLDDALREGLDDLVAMIAAGTAPRDAVAMVIDGFQAEWRATMATAFAGLLSQGVGSALGADWPSVQVALSARLYAQANTVSRAVEGVVRRHTLGFTDARRLALELFEGYSFRAPDAEPLRLNPREPRLPQYMRQALMTDDKVAGAMRSAFARLQVSNLRTEALRAAYTGVLDAIDAIEAGPGAALQRKRIEVAFFERMRYFSTRIAQTELHRAYSIREAAILMDDEDVEFVQIRRAPGVGDPCICALMIGRDLFGMGAGVYPKARAPRPPFHPFCRCVMSPRLDLTGKTAKPEDPEGDAYFLRRLNGSIAGRIMGSRAKAESVLKGVRAEAVANAGRDAGYHIKPMGQR